MGGDKRMGDRAGRAIQVRLAFPSGRPIQVRYECPLTGKQVRITTGTRDPNQADLEKKRIAEELRSGLDPLRKAGKEFGPGMSWEEFRYEYESNHLAGLRDSTALHARSRLDLAERIIKPRTLGEMADPHNLTVLRTKLAAGVESRTRIARSPHTVRGYMKTVVSVLRWAYEEGWLPDRPRIRRMPVSKQKAMKGRPISALDFDAMLEAVPRVVGGESAEPWRHLLRGLWESGLRLGELLSVSWGMEGTIWPFWNQEGEGVLKIPAAMQKNNVEEDIPLVPWFESLLLETPPGARRGWVFQAVTKRRMRADSLEGARPTKEWVGKVITNIGKAAGIVVEPANPVTGCPEKYASAHDLRRSFGQRLRDAGVPPLTISGVMRHSSWDTTQRHYAPMNVASEIQVLRKVLGAD